MADVLRHCSGMSGGPVFDRGRFVNPPILEALALRPAFDWGVRQSAYAA